MYKNPNSALIAGGITAMYLYAGSKLSSGQITRGYDIGTGTPLHLSFNIVKHAAASLALLAAKAPKAYHTREAYAVTMATLGLVSLVGNGLKSYQTRTGKPHDLQMKPVGSI